MMKIMELYNEERKNEFLKQYDDNEQTRGFYKKIFMNTAELEYSFGKDLCEFNNQELEEVFYKIGRNSLFAILQRMKFMKSYTKHCQGKGYSLSNILPTIYLSGDEYFEKYIKEIEFYSYSTLKEEIEQLSLFDQVTVLLLFHGLSIKEVSLLKKGDIDIKNNRIYTKNRKELGGVNSEFIEVDDYTINKIVKSNNSKEYSVPAPERMGGERTVYIGKTDYVISKRFYSQEKADEAESKPFPAVNISNRIFNIEKSGILEISIKAKAIETNGMIYYAAKKVKEEELDITDAHDERDVLFSLCERFNRGWIVLPQQSLLYPRRALFQQFITLENIQNYEF